MNQHSFFRLVAREIRRLNGSVKIRGASRILAHLIAIAAISVVNLAGFCFIGRIDFAAVIQEVGQPVVVFLVFLDGGLHYLGLDDFVIAGNDALCTLDNPLKDCAARHLEQEVRIVLDVSFALDLGVEGDHDEPPPGTLVNGPDPWQMVGVQHQRVGGDIGERRLVLFLRIDFIRGAELLDIGGVQAHPLLQLGGDDGYLYNDAKNLNNQPIAFLFRHHQIRNFHLLPILYNPYT